MIIKQERLQKGLFWDRALRLVAGCTKISPACDNCWAEKEHLMRQNHPSGGMRKQYPKKATWKGKIELLEHNLDKPVKEKKPAVWSVWNDLFHESVPFDFIASVIAVMTVLCRKHTFLILTKRPERIVDYFEWWDEKLSEDFTDPRIKKILLTWLDSAKPKYYENIWFGTTVESSNYLWRIEELIKTPGHHFVNLEPLLGEVELRPYLGLKTSIPGYPKTDSPQTPDSYPPFWHAIDWVICGGESGKNARPSHIDWFRKIQVDCKIAGVPFFFKQWGEWYPHNGTNPYDKGLVNIGLSGIVETSEFTLQCAEQYGAIPCYAEETDGCVMERIGKKKAGRLLDDEIYLEVPED